MGTARNRQAKPAALNIKEGGQADDSPSRSLVLLRILHDPPPKPPCHLLRGAWVNKPSLSVPGESVFSGDGKSLARLVNAERGRLG